MIRTVRESEREKKTRTLKDLEVLEVGIFGVDIEFDARHRNIHYSSLDISLTNGERRKGGWCIGEKTQLKMESKIWQNAALQTKH